MSGSDKNALNPDALPVLEHELLATFKVIIRNALVTAVDHHYCMHVIA